MVRLIDAKNQYIVSINLYGSQLKDHVALSYVWGDKKQSYALTTETYLTLQSERSLVRLKLPTTVSNTMLLVERYGLRYLWVDVLCIHQDDISDKHKQIAGIGFVYQSALFKIVAASSTDCDAGLLGIRPGTRFNEQKFIQAGNITLVSPVQSTGHQILTAHSSKWAHIGRTFQEELLSAHQLIFTHE